MICLHSILLIIDPFNCSKLKLSWSNFLSLIEGAQVDLKIDSYFNQLIDYSKNAKSFQLI
jgi:hypothetical protein